MKICKRCQEPVCASSTCYCEKHLEDNRRYSAKSMQLKRARGVCTKCGDMLSPDSVSLCERHLEQHRSASLNRHNGRKGKCCVICQGVLSDKSTVHCDRHRLLYKNKSSRFDRLKAKARSRNVIFDLTKDAFESWLSQQNECFYCGVTEKMLLAAKRPKSIFSIDRRDNAKGYCLSNIALCCMRCNNLKSNFFTETEWLEICSRFVRPRLFEYHCCEPT